jgi:hemerythrin-like domain-containing protein
VCEYCGCQAITAIDLLTREHDRALDHVRAAEQAARSDDLAAAQRACLALQGLLAPHTAVEEQALFPALEADFAEQVGCLREEHRSVEAAVDDLAEGGAPAGWAAQLDAAMSLLRGHILREQDGVFPAALSSLRPADWERLDAVRARVGSAVEQAGARS